MITFKTEVMKKLLIILFVGLFVIRCEENLQEVPESFLTQNNFINDPNYAISTLHSIYATFDRRNSYPLILFMALLENRAEYSDGRGSQVPISIYDKPLDNTNQVRAFNCWNDIYNGINRANNLLDNIDAVTELDPGLKARYIAEAKFLRAYFYSDLVKYWGAVPLRTNVFVDLADLPAPRTPASEIWRFIIDELTQAIPDLPQEIPPTSEVGRANAWAARMLLANAYLNTQDWNNAREQADFVIKNSPYSLVQVNSSEDFLNIYGPEVTTHSEDIWSFQFTGVNGTSLPTFIAPGAVPGFSVAGYRAWLPVSTSILSSWDKDDLRRNFNLYNAQDIAETGVTFSEWALFGKWRDGGAPTAGSNRNNIPVFRLAEAYLIYAEAANEVESGPSALAYERLNTIRRRGYGLPLGTSSEIDVPSGLSANEFRNKVLEERAYEFVLELKRWNDLLRTGTAREAVEATGKTFMDFSLLFPIPFDEINNNPALSESDQNPGY
ncbi:MAG: RagB/SusD family nutrient uptake outer membrane protein [Flavobacteriaceae bacterium]|nr:RagB/SusD family nutrient uptake outer membrane protein [Flavobacteriaceae bacterium]MCY4253888.1 RagB/SusD family nutrient uptake outer membrane protein [Flavobacteriaceae bacterium]